MPAIHIHRDHQLGLAKARKIAWAWAEDVESRFGMDCTVHEGDEADEVHFERAGVKGSLRVDAVSFELHAQLGLLLGALRGSIEREIEGELDRLLKVAPPKKAPAKAKKA